MRSFAASAASPHYSAPPAQKISVCGSNGKGIDRRAQAQSRARPKEERPSIQSESAALLPELL